MNINFAAFKPSLNNIKKLSTNPIKANSLSGTNEISFGKLSNIDYRNSKVKYQNGLISDYEKQLSELKASYEAGEISEEEYNSGVMHAKTKIADAKAEIIKLEEEIKIYEEFENRPNAQFLYHSELTPKEKAEEIKKHPEFKTLNQIATEAGNPNIGYLSAMHRFFMIDNVGGEQYIDTSYYRNKENYETLRRELGGKIPLDKLYYKHGLPEKLIKELATRGAIDRIELTNIKTGKKGYADFIPQEIEDKVENIRTLVPKKSKFYKQLLRDKNQPLLVPVSHLSKLGYGTPKQLLDMYKKGFLRGTQEFAEKDGKKISYTRIDISSQIAEGNLDLLKRKNKNYLSVAELAKQLKVKRCEIERAIINGDLIANNEYLFSSPDKQESGICLYNNINRQFIEKLAFEEQAKASLVTEESNKKERNKSLIGLRVKIAWHLSPHTRQVALELAKDDGYLAKVIKKEARIRQSSDDVEKTETLTKPEQIKINEYRKSFWEEAGTEEFSRASKMAYQIVNTYVEDGIDAIEDPEIRKIIEEYVS